MNQLVLISSKEELKEAFREVLREEHTSKITLDLGEKMTRTEASKFLDVHLQTMYNWTKSGILTEHGYGKKKFYLRQELIEAMKNEKSLERR